MLRFISVGRLLFSNVHLSGGIISEATKTVKIQVLLLRA